MFGQAFDLMQFSGRLPLGNAVSEYGEDLWAEFAHWIARMGPEEYLVLAGISVGLGFMLLMSTGLRR